ncbi:MAG TPA: hypothetical protein VIX84_18510 [Acidimicrobiales bacterium]
MHGPRRRGRTPVVAAAVIVVVLVFALANLEKVAIDPSSPS